MKLLGGIFGAMVGAGLVLGPSRTVRLHSDPSMIDRPTLMAIATVVAMVAGAVVGARMASQLSEDEEDALEAPDAPGTSRIPGRPPLARSAGPPGAPAAPGAPGVAGLLNAFRILRVPIAIVCLLAPVTGVVDAFEPRPVKGRARAQWATKLMAHNANYPGAFPKRAADLAYRIRGCIGNVLWFDASLLIGAPGCANLAASQFGLSPDSLAALGAYRLGDQGWRWQVIEDSDPTRVAIRPDPLLQVAGPIPVYEVMSRATFLREDRGEPAYSVDSVIIRSAHAHACLVASAEELRHTGRWDGDGRTLPPLLLDPGHEPPEGCPGFRPAPSGLTWYGGTVLDTKELRRWRLRYRAKPGATTDTPFRVTFIHDANMHYMVDEHGQWHVRLGGEPSLTDPPPDECLFDHDVPCFD